MQAKNKAKKYVFEITCSDATGLGGPMGSERTTLLWQECFHKRKDAVQYAIDFCKKRKCDKHIMDSVKELKTQDSIDAYAYLFDIDKKVIR